MPTTNPVPSQDPSDLLFNAGKLDEVVNGTANSFTDRLGVARRTVAGMNADFDAQLADAESDLNVYRADAAASAAEALGYLQTIRATSYGAYAEDPATDPLGNPPTVGDEYFNTTANLLKRWNGTTWQASDINTANLAAPSGSSLVGYISFGTGAIATTVQDFLRELAVSVKRFGAVGDGQTDDTVAIQKAVDSGFSLFWPEAPNGYLVTSTVTVKRRQSWFGVGPFKSYIRNATPAGSAALLFTETASPDEFPSLRYNDFCNFGVIGGIAGTGLIGDNPNCGDGIRFESAPWIRFENVASFANKNGVVFGDSNIAIRFDRCIIKANREIGVYDQVHATSALECVDVSFVECNIEQSVKGAVVNSGKMRLSGCTIEANTETDIELNKEATVVDCYIEKTVGGTAGSPKYMLKMATAAYGAQVHGNRFLMNNADYLHGIDYANHCTVGGNVFFNVDTANGSRPINFSGSSSTNSIFVGNIDISGSNFGSDTPILVNQSQVKAVQSQFGSVLFDNSSVAAANALDYYLEGTFTPAAIGTTDAGTGTYGYNTGRYTRIGNRVFFDLSIFWTAHTGTGNVRLTGLPFTSNSATVPLSAVTLSYSSLAMGSGKIAVGNVLSNSTTIDIQQSDPTGAAASIGIPLENGNVIIFVSGSYAV